MPRDGSNVYTQPFPNVVDGTTIESAVYNGYTNDVTIDLNTARPIVAGGTGATSADQALVNLSGEKAAMLVTNYDSHLWQPGSFYSAVGASGAPPSGGTATHAFSGIAYGSDPVATPPANQNVVLEARDVTDNKAYIRRKTAGVWSAWASEADTSGFVETAGDTMTGSLTVNSQITSNVTATTGTYHFGSSGTKYLNYDGTSFRFAGGTVYNTNFIADGGAFFSALTATTGTYHFGLSGTKYLTYDGSSFTFVGGPVYNTSFIANGGPFYAAQTATTGTYHFGLSSTKYLTYDGADYTLVGGSLHIAQGSGFHLGNKATAGIYGDGTAMAFRAFGNNACYIQNSAGSITYGAFTSAAITPAGGFCCKAGQAAAPGSNVFNLNYTGSVALWIDVSNLGNISTTSDYRIKKDVIDLPGMWDTVKALRPIKYTQAEFQPPVQADHVADQLKKKSAGELKEEVNTAPLFAADDIERWGFIAHELQEALVPSAAAGEKDSYDTVQSLNLAVLVAALTKALQEAMARIEALEAA
jgi:hypothetical protein